jgi:hypothetical protein
MPNYYKKYFFTKIKKLKFRSKDHKNEKNQKIPIFRSKDHKNDIFKKVKKCDPRTTKMVVLKKGPILRSWDRIFQVLKKSEF